MGIFEPYAQTLARNWLAIVLRGVAAVLFGLLTLFSPGLSLVALVFAFGGYALADGVLAFLSAVGQRQALRWVYAVEGVCGVAVGVLVLLWPGLTLLSLSYLVAARALAAGVLEIAAAIRLGRVVRTEWPLGASGAMSCVFAVLLVLWPGAGLLTMALGIGSYALLFGAAFIALGLRLRDSTSSANRLRPGLRCSGRRRWEAWPMAERSSRRRRAQAAGPARTARAIRDQ